MYTQEQKFINHVKKIAFDDSLNPEWVVQELQEACERYDHMNKIERTGSPNIMNINNTTSEKLK